MNSANPSHRNINTVAILGGGPAACALAILLCRAGLQVAMWHKPKTAPLIVGESLVPAVIPMLQNLGVEDAIRGFSMFKPGATFNLSNDINFSFFFKNPGKSLYVNFCDLLSFYIAPTIVRLKFGKNLPQRHKDSKPAWRQTGNTK